MKTFLTLLFTIFAALILWALIQKPISESGALLLKDPWGLVTLVDLYIGFFIFIIFIQFLERKFWKTLLWSASLLLLGNLVSIAYILYNYRKIKVILEKV